MRSKTSLRRALDSFEQVTFTLLFIWLFIRLWPDDFTGVHWFPILLLISEGIVVLFLVVRRRTEHISQHFGDWVVALGGTLFSLLVVRGGTTIFGNLGPLLLVAGILLHICAKLSIRRSFGIVAADRGVKTGGAFRYVRHPMYFGYMLSHIGYLFIAPVAWNLLMYGVSWSFLVARIFAEERVLSQNPAYRAYMKEVPHRLIPFVF